MRNNAQLEYGNDKVGLLRCLATAKGFEVERNPTSATWLLLELASGRLAETYLGATGFTWAEAIAYLEKRPDAV